MLLVPYCSLLRKTQTVPGLTRSMVPHRVQWWCLPPSYHTDLAVCHVRTIPAETVDLFVYFVHPSHHRCHLYQTHACHETPWSPLAPHLWRVDITTIVVRPWPFCYCYRLPHLLRSRTAAFEPPITKTNYPRFTTIMRVQT